MKMYAIQCLKCGYKMKTSQALTATGVHVVTGASSMTKGFMGGVANQKIGNSDGVKCPKCQTIGQWEDL